MPVAETSVGGGVPFEESGELGELGVGSGDVALGEVIGCSGEVLGGVGCAEAHLGGGLWAVAPSPLRLVQAGYWRKTNIFE